jgi:transposase
MYCMSTILEQRNQKRKKVVETIVVWQEPVYLVQRIDNVCERTNFNRLVHYRSAGWVALNEGSLCGRPKKVTADDITWNYDTVTMGIQANYQLGFCLWTLNNLCALSKQEREVTLSKSSMSRLLGHLGLTPLRPTYYKSNKQDKDRINEYLV